MNSTDAPRIAVVGAGLGGLALARVLQLHGRSVTVFDREASVGARPQGGSLDIHAGTGQAALRAAGLLDRFRALARPESQEWRVLDPVTATALPFPGPVHDDDSPEIDRGQLRGLLLESLVTGTVRWGCTVTAATPLGDGTWRLLLDDGTTEDADLVVGADGAWSRIRPALSDATPGYTGVTFVETGIDDCDTRHPALARMVGNGTLLATADSKALFAQRNSNGHIRVYIAFRAPQNWQPTTDLELEDTAAVRAHLLKMFDGWDERLLHLLRHHDGGFVNRPVFVLPVPHTWEHVPGITLLGDAAHLMPPVGLGANLAMLDGADLAHALITESSIDDAVRAYERLMLPRSAQAARDCAEALDNLLPPAGS
ncbi:2-polyprenyl-6-methoxyphenol hydroxylase-like FAD-dependent oxidoreductase [Streptomyces puniciscabiei]|uniref:Flavin-dependent monooxygenase n=1 Tax=Streptomyces puniciscabiei TaxID=164348 RepID=A0A542THN4_9ACTN|nr:NAD(P)/FAD-dependent oxidoreductase [Streptomyces puniciscabiei]TQK86318.1 2-polyprenyl-6-methoxyphenol hydroxylase-like FAD-dependent oxidoreductase [Streptomyces puniciscabiei]